MPSKLHERIAFARTTRKLGQEQLGQMFSEPISKSAISQWESAPKGKKPTVPTIPNLIEFLRFTGAPADWLLSDDSELRAHWLEPDRPQTVTPVPYAGPLPVSVRFQQPIAPYKVARAVRDEILGHIEKLSPVQLSEFLQKLRETVEANLAVYKTLSERDSNHRDE